MYKEIYFLRYSGNILPHVKEAEFLFKEVIKCLLNNINRSYLNIRTMQYLLRLESLNISKQVAERIPSHSLFTEIFIQLKEKGGEML